MISEAVEKPHQTFSLDDFLRALGKFGRYQLLVFGSICLLVLVSGSYAISFIFTAGNVNYRCRIPECDSDVKSDFLPEWLENAVPFDGQLPKPCTRFRFRNLTSFSCEAGNFERKIEESCTEDIIFEEYEKTIATEFNLTCDEKWKLSFVATMHNIAYFCNLLVVGYLSDRFGRKKVFMFSILVGVTIGLMKSFSRSYATFLSLEIIETFLSSGFFSSAYILAVEVLSPEIRSKAGPFFMTCATVSSVIIAGLTWWFRDWKITLRIIYGLGYISIFYFWIIPESFHWLLSKKKNKEVANVLLKVARINKSELSQEMKHILENRPDDIRLETKEQTPGNNGDQSFFDIFKYPKFYLRFLACTFCWITNVFVFSGLTYTSVAIGGNKFLSFIAVGLIDIPGQFFAYFFVDKIGRKKMLNLTYFLSGSALMISAFIPDIYWLRLILYLIGKFAIEAAFSTTYIFTSEIFPTSLRHRLFGLCSCFGRIGSIVSSQAPLLQDIYKPLPALLFATCAIISGFLSLTFPETLNTSLPDTIEDALNIGKSRKKLEL